MDCWQQANKRKLVNPTQRTVDLALIRDALSSSTLNHGLKLIGDYRTAQVLLGAFIGHRRFEDWLSSSDIPRHTLAERLRSLTRMDILRPRLYQASPKRYAHHLTRKGLALYDALLMIWSWELRYGQSNQRLPVRLIHGACGHAFHPELSCRACGETVTLYDLTFTLQPNPRLLQDADEPLRTPRLRAHATSAAGFALGLRVDRWSLMLITAIVLGCRHFDQLSFVLRISPGVLSKRLAAMVDSHLLLCETDRNDARRKVYRLTPSSRGLFGYIVCLANWSGAHHFHEPSSIRPTHRVCGHLFTPCVTCSYCHEIPQPWEVSFEMRPEILHA